MKVNMCAEEKGTNVAGEGVFHQLGQVGAGDDQVGHSPRTQQLSPDHCVRL